MNHWIVRNETPGDYRTVEEATREAFWNVYQPGCSEHYFVHCMREHEDFVPELAFVLEEEGTIIGSIFYTTAILMDEAGEKKTILTFGPLSVRPEYQRQGGSRMLIEASFARARELGYGAVAIFGNPANYVGRGFVSCRKKKVSLGEGIFPTALLVKELVPGALEGHEWQFVESSAGECCADAAAVEACDSTFPPREKAWRPSQEEFYIYSHSRVVR